MRRLLTGLVVLLIYRYLGGNVYIFTRIVLIAILFLCGSCTLAPVYLPDTEGAQTISELNTWVYRHIKYVEDEIQYTQEPQETLIKRTGDCEDQAELLIYLSEQLLDVYPKMIIEWNRLGGHAVVQYNGKIYDPTNGNTKE